MALEDAGALKGNATGASGDDTPARAYSSPPLSPLTPSESGASSLMTPSPAAERNDLQMRGAEGLPLPEACPF